MGQTDVVRQENGCSVEGLAESRIIGHAYVRGVQSRFGRKLSLDARLELANNPGAKRAVGQRTATVQMRRRSRS